MLYVSPAYEKVWGRPVASLYQNPKSFIDAIHEEDRERVIHDLEVRKKLSSVRSRVPHSEARWRNPLDLGPRLPGPR